jgi:exonuclease VII small subunit
LENLLVNTLKESREHYQGATDTLNEATDTLNEAEEKFNAAAENYDNAKASLEESNTKLTEANTRLTNTNNTLAEANRILTEAVEVREGTFVISDTMPTSGPCIWFNTSGKVDAAAAVVLDLGDEGTDVMANIDGEDHGVENIEEGESTETESSYNII